MRWATTSVSVSEASVRPAATTSSRSSWEVLDDAVVDEGHPLGGVGMGVLLVGHPVGRPAGVADADGAGQAVAAQKRFQVGELALGAAAFDAAVDQGGDAGRIVAPVFEPLEPLEEKGRDLGLADDAGDPAHGRLALLAALIGGFFCRRRGVTAPPFALRWRKRAAAPSTSIWSGRVMASASADTSLVMTLPAAVMAPAPTVTGATNEVLVPMKAPSPMVGEVLVNTVVVARDGAGADVGAGANPGVADVGQVVDLGPGLDRGVLDLDEVPDVGRPARCAHRGAGGAKGPTRTPAPTWAPSRCEKERISAPSPTATPGPNTTWGPTVTSRPMRVSKLK